MRVAKQRESYEEVAKRIEKLIEDNPGYTSLLIGSKMGYSEFAIYPVLSRMLAEGRITFSTKGDRYRHYHLTASTPGSFTPDDPLLLNYEEVESYEPAETTALLSEHYKKPVTHQNVSSARLHTVRSSLEQYQAFCDWWGMDPSLDGFKKWAGLEL